MAVTLTNNRIRPQDGDQGQVVFDALENNINLDDAHIHDGVNSEKLSTSLFTRGTVAVPNSGWSASGDLFRQTVTFPSGYSTANGSDFGNAHIRYFLNGGTLDGEEVYPKTEKITATTFYLYSPVSNQAFDLVFV